MTKSFNNGLCFWIDKDVKEDVFRSMQHHCYSARIVLGDSDIESLNSHFGKYCLLFKRIHMSTKFLKRIAELKVQNSCLGHRVKSS